MKNSRRKICASLALSFVALAGCSSSITPPPEPTFSVSGTLRFATAITLPTNIRVACVWNDTVNYGAFPPSFGTATFDTLAKTFLISFKGIPPSLSVDDGAKHLRLGDGYIILVSDPPRGAESHQFGPLYGSIFGAVNNTVIHYHTSNFLWNPPYDCLNSFPQGYAVGRGIPRTDSSGVDNLISAPNTGLELVIDTTAANFHLPVVIETVKMVTGIR